MDGVAAKRAGSIPQEATANTRDAESEHAPNHEQHDHSDGQACPACVGGHTSKENESKRLKLALAGGLFVLAGYIGGVIPNHILDPKAAEGCALIGALLLAFPVFKSTFKDLLTGKIYMNELVALALVAAFASSNYKEAGAVAFFMLITTIIERRTAIGAENAIESLVKLTPRNARLIVNGQEKEVSINDLKVDDNVRVRPGENFPADGVILKGTSTVNQASITGESLPVDKTVEADVFAGTQNLTGVVDVRVTRVGSQTTLGKVRELISAAEKARLPVTRMIDLYIKYHTPAVLILAGLVWGMTRQLENVIAVLVVSCPCALIVAQPSCVVAALAAAARLGVLIKDVALLDVVSRVKVFVFDKTGTLTVGNLQVAKLQPLEGVSMGELLTAAVSAECHSNHPAANAMRNLAQKADVEWSEPDTFQEITGKGVHALIKGDEVRVGRVTWLAEEGLDVVELKQSANTEDTVGMTQVGVASGKRVLGWIGLRDTSREGAAQAVSELKGLGVKRCCMVTGDSQSVADMVSEKLEMTDVKAECLPEEKSAYVDELKHQGYSVAVVGDGVNDAPALAKGDVGIAMGAIGSEVAVESASIALMNNDLRRLPFLVSLARKSRMVTIQNVVIALVFILGGLYFAMTGVLEPLFAVLLHFASTIVVSFNSARLIRAGEEFEQAETADSAAM